MKKIINPYIRKIAHYNKLSLKYKEKARHFKWLATFWKYEKFCWDLDNKIRTMTKGLKG